MKTHHTLFLALVLASITAPGIAQSKIYRCGNEYTNSPPAGQHKNCTVVEGGNVTVIEGTRPQAAPSGGGAQPRVVTAPPGAPKVDSTEQRARDADARGILEAELRKAEARRAELLKEYNEGTPERIAGEVGNDLRYQNRVAELKASIERIESDLAGIRRELGRVASR
ncbi:MAG: hypothetical protein ABI589_05345 [Burkholderiales bacterium]